VSQILTGPLITAGTVVGIAVIGWVASWLGASRANRRNLHNNSAELATELIAAVAMLKGEVITFHATWIRHQRRRMLLAACSEYFAAGAGLHGYGAAARTIFAWERDSVLAVRHAVTVPLTQLTAAAVRVSYSGTTALSQAARALTDVTVQVPASARNVKSYARKVDEAVAVFTEVARREAGI
jgi:hypothetical protein